MNCGKNVKLKPKNIRIAAKRAQPSGYIRPVAFGYQKCSPAKKADTAPPTMM